VPQTRKILTLHSPIGADVVDQLLTSIEDALHRVGATRVWIDPRSTHDLTVMAELPDPADRADAAEVPDPRLIDESVESVESDAVRS